MAITYVGKADTVFAAATMSPVVNLPTVQAGDFMIGVTATDTNHTAQSSGSWTWLGRVSVGTDTTVSVIYRFATGSEGSTETLTSFFTGSSESGTFSIAAYRGVDENCPIAGVSSRGDTTSDTTWVTPSIDYFPEPDCALVLMGGMDPGASSRTATAPTDFTERTDYTTADVVGWTWIGDYIGPTAESDYVVANGSISAADTIGGVIVLLLPAIRGVQRRYAGTVADDATVGTVAWTTPTAAQGAPNIDITTTQAWVTMGLATSHYLKATNFGFALPAGATIRGIQAHVMAAKSGGSGWIDSAVRIVKADGTIGTTDRSSARAWVQSATEFNFCDVIPHGSRTDAWGETWTETDIEDVDFGVAISANNPSVSSTTGRVNCIVISVYYGGSLLYQPARPTIYRL